MTKIATVGTRRRVSGEHAERMIDALKRLGYTDAALAEKVGLGAKAVAHWRRGVRRSDAGPNIYIEGWTADSRGRMFTPVYRLGDGVDAERHGDSITDAERMRRLRATRKKGGV